MMERRDMTSSTGLEVNLTTAVTWWSEVSEVSFLQVASVHVWATWQLGDPSPEGGGPASPSHL